MNKARKRGDTYSDRYDRVEDGTDHVPVKKWGSRYCQECGRVVISMAWTVPFHSSDDEKK